jgi:WD40 repeat protein
MKLTVSVLIYLQILCGLLWAQAPDDSGGLPVQPLLRIESGMHSAPIRGIAVDAAGESLVTASEDKTIRLWNLQTAQLRQTWRLPSDEGDVGKALAVAISPDGRVVAGGGFTGGKRSGEQVLYLYSTRTGKLIAPLGRQPSSINHLAYSPDGRYLAACYAQGHGIRIYRLDLEEGRVQLPYVDVRYGKSSSFWVDWIASKAPSGEPSASWQLATTSLDGSVRIYDIPLAAEQVEEAPVKPTATAKLPEGLEPFACSFSPDGRALAVGCNGQPRVFILDAEDLRLMAEPDLKGISADAGDLSRVAWSSDGSRLLAGGTHHDETGQNPVLVWGDAGQGARSRWPGGGQTVTQILALREGRTVVATGDPLWTVLAADGAAETLPEDSRFQLGGFSRKADFTGANLGRFHLSNDGSRIEIGTRHEGRDPFAFSVQNLSGRNAGPEPETGLTPALLESKGLKIELDRFHPTFNGTVITLEPNEACRSGVVEPSGDRFLLGTSFGLRGFDKKGTPLWPPLRGPGEVWAVNISGDGRFAVAAYGDGTIRWHRMRDGAPLLSLYLHRGGPGAGWEWICWAPEGYYQASANGDDLIGWQVNRASGSSPDFYRANQLKAVFQDREDYGILPKIIASAQSATNVVGELVTAGTMREPPTLEESLAGVPILEFSGAEQLDGQVIESSSLEVKVIARPSDPAIAIDGKSLVLSVGGIPQSGDRKGIPRLQPDGVWTCTWQVPLAPGRNELRAVARSEKDTKSAPVSLVVYSKTKEPEQGDLWILGIGLNSYRNSRFDLSYCVADVEGLIEALTARGRGFFRGEPHVRKLLDAQATRANVLREVADLGRETKPEDTFVVIYAGHGALLDHPGSGEDPDYCMVLHDVIQMTDRGADLAENGLPFPELGEALAKVKAQRQIIFLDSCHAAAAGKLERRGASQEVALRNFRQGTGTWILASSGPEQASRGHLEFGHGLFSHALIEGLREGKAAAGADLITLTALSENVRERVSTLSQEKFGIPQFTKLFGPPDENIALGWAQKSPSPR